MSAQSVKDHLARYGLDDQIITLDTSSATVDLAAAALGCEPDRIAKTLSFLVEEKPLIVVVAGERRIDNRKFRNTFQAKARMIPAADVLNLLGHEVGGVCPFGLPEGIPVYLDLSLKDYDTVFPACGSHNNAIEITPERMEEITGASWVDVSKSRIS